MLFGVDCALHILLTMGRGSHQMARTDDNCPGGPPGDITERAGKPLPGERCPPPGFSIQTDGSEDDVALVNLRESGGGEGEGGEGGEEGGGHGGVLEGFWGERVRR